MYLSKKKKKIKTMNSKMTINSQLSTTEPKKSKSKKNPTQNQANTKNKNRITEMEIIWRVISGEGAMIQGIRNIIGRYKIDRER